MKQARDRRPGDSPSQQPPQKTGRQHDTRRFVFDRHLKQGPGELPVALATLYDPIDQPRAADQLPEYAKQGVTASDILS